MRIRTVKPEFFEDQTVSSWSPLTRLLYIGLWCMSDDCGRFQADIATIRAALAKKDRPQDVERALEEIEKSGKVIRYEDHGEFYGVVTQFWHQKVDKPSPPQWPCPPESAWTVICEKAKHNKRFRGDVSQRLQRMADDASPPIRRMVAECSSPSRTRALEQGSEGAREQGSECPPAVQQVGNPDDAHRILVAVEPLKSLTWEEDILARQRAGLRISDPRLVAFAKKAADDAVLMRDLDAPPAWWRRQIEKHAGLLPGQFKKNGEAAEQRKTERWKPEART